MVLWNICLMRERIHVLTQILKRVQIFSLALILSLAKKRPSDVEAVYENLKPNKNFKRFMLHGMEKIEIERLKPREAALLR